MLNTTFIAAKAKRAAALLINPALCQPKSARLIITLNCPFRCQMCTFWYHPHWQNRKNDPSLETVRHWIKEMADFGIKEIDLGGGEPFVRNDLVEIVKEIKAHGMKCGLTTNGWFVGRVPFPPIDFCEISIDGAKPETNDKIRGIKGGWERAVEAVKIAKQHCPTKINFVVQADNYLEMVDYCHLAKKLGVLVTFIPVSLKLAAQPNLENHLSKYNIPVLRRQIDQAMKTGVVLNSRLFFDNFLAKLEKGPFPQKCMAPYRCILVFADSDIYPCGNFDVPVGKLSIGASFKDLYNSYADVRKKVWAGKHEFCGQCVYGDLTTRKTIISSAIPFLTRSLKE